MSAQKFNLRQFGFQGTFTLLLISCLISLSGCFGSVNSDVRPSNILLIVADDFGYTDLSVFGGEIETPNLDELIANGVTFSRFHTAPFCAVTRAMLLSGNDNHIAGMGSQDLRTGLFGYEGHLTDRIVTIPQVLKDAGYSTGMAGKWHLGKRPEDGPAKKGFDHSFVLLDGGGNHYSDRGIFPTIPVSLYTENGDSISWPEGAYSTDLYTDKLIQYINLAVAEDKPFFSYAAYTTPHWPLQVDEEYWKKYEGRYDDGYEVLRLKRFNKMKELGILPHKKAPRHTTWVSPH
ncbi:MAG: sulfatase-like hydrolase/transferase [Bacteroidetes bacterium]|jgi:arylsulfatase|nr:sulfatase-like hydrolase/transferase [Bacteroidota bacterium]